MDEVLDAKTLREFRRLLRENIGIEIEDDDEVMTAVFSCLKFTAAKLLRQADLLE